MPAPSRTPRFLKGLGVTARTAKETMFPDGLKNPIPSARRKGAGHRAVPAREGGARGARGPRRHLAAGGQLHVVHAVRPRVPRLVHLHRGAQDARAAAPRGRQAPFGQQARPLRHRLLALHVLRHLRRGLPVRGAVLVARSTSTPRSASPTCCTTRSGSASGSRRCPTSSRTRPAPRSSRSGVAEGREVIGVAARARRPTCPFAVPANIAFGIGAAFMIVRGDQGRHHQATSCTPRCTWWWCSAGVGINYLLLQAEFVADHPVPRLHRRHRRAVPVRHHADPGPARASPTISTTRAERPLAIATGGRRCWSVTGGVAHRELRATTRITFSGARTRSRPCPTRSSAPTSSRSRSSRSCCSPRSSAPSSWRRKD